MKKTQNLMGMHITVEIVDENVVEKDINKIFEFFRKIDDKFSPYKKTSEVARINSGELKPKNYSEEMKVILDLANKTKEETGRYFNIIHNKKMDPSGIVKGWAIYEASKILKKKFNNFYIDAGGDIQAFGKNSQGSDWKVGIKNPFNRNQIVKIVKLNNLGIATSGTYIRGQHIYNPFDMNEIKDIVSLTVIGSNVYEADRFATAAFAMGEKGIIFIENLKGFEGYMINKKGIATYTSGFHKFVYSQDFNSNLQSFL